MWWWLAACTGANPPPDLVVDFEGECAAEWPADTCSTGNCTPLPVAERYAEAFLKVFQDLAGWTDLQMDTHATLRQVVADQATQTSRHTLTLTLTADWLTFLHTRQEGAPGADPDAEAIEAEFREFPFAPQLDPDAELVLSARDVIEALEDCEAEHAVELPRTGWCAPWVQTDPDDDDRGLRFDFARVIGPELILFTANVVTGEVVCRRSQAFTER